MENSSAKRSLCGIWIAPDGAAHLSLGTSGGGRRETVEPFRPFAWGDERVAARDLPPDTEVHSLSGPGQYNRLLSFPRLPAWKEFHAAGRNVGLDYLRSLESQFLIAAREQLFQGMRFMDLRRCQCDIETTCCETGAFSDARRAQDRVVAIGLRWGEREELMTIDECTDAGERRLLKRFGERIVEEDPDVIEGHNIFRFDLDFLRQRCRRFQLPCAWGRFGQTASFRTARLKVAERWIDFPRCDIPGRTVFDTYLMVLLYDLTGREMPSYGLKEVALHFGITSENGPAGRTYLRGREIECAFFKEREKFLAYLADDLRETKGIADRLLPTYFAQAAAFPMTLQEASLRGTSGKVDLLMLQEYFHEREALPVGVEVKSFAGGFTRSYETGVFRNVWHFDVASLYPSILLNLGRNPAGDSMGAFIPLLQRLREYRLRYKNLAREAANHTLREEYQARQTNYKILINSFYGYLGFSGARFADGDLAAKVTEEGRQLLQALIGSFRRAGCRILEADTDGIYLTAPEEVDRPERLLETISGDLPPGIDLEFDGHYAAMFCYKAKNYALYDGEKITLRGSALRSRGMEPYLQHLTTHLIRWLLQIEERPPQELIADLRERLAMGKAEISEIARSENLSQHPEVYLRAVEAEGGKNRRASMEAALRLNPIPRMGDRISYYIARPLAGRPPDWQRARPVEEFDAATAPYDAEHYIRKLDEWLKRYEEFFAAPGEKLVQGELF